MKTLERLYEVGVRYEKTLENGLEKKVTEQYIVRAVTFSDAENKIVEEMTPFIHGPFDVVSEKRTRYIEIVRGSDAGAVSWYNVKIKLVCLNEKTGKGKESRIHLLVFAKDIDGVREVTRQHMKGTVSDWSVESIVETKYIDVFDDYSAKTSTTK